MKNALNLIENGLAILGLIFFTSGLDTLLPSSIITMLRYGIWLTASLLLCLRWQRTLYTARNDWFIWIVTGLGLASIAWSAYPQATTLQIRELLQMSAFGLYMASRFSLKQQLQRLAAALGIAVFLSVVVAIAMPSTGIDFVEHIGAWKGIYVHKNALGAMMVLSSVVFALLLNRKQRHGWLTWVGFAASVALVILSTSKTALSLLVMILLLLWIYRQYRWKGERTIVLLSLGILVFGGSLTLVLGNWVTILTGMGRDPTLTGRTVIWGVALQQLQTQPWLGFGRGAFWAPGSKYAMAVGQAFSLGLQYIPPHSHNGFIDIALDLGLIGFTAFLCSWIIAYVRALKRAYLAKAPEDLWPLAFLTLLVMNNMTESVLMRQSTIFWVLYLMVTLSVKPDNRLEPAEHPRAIAP